MSVKCDHGTAVPSPWLFEGNVPRTQAVLPRWTATEMRWRRKLVERTSLLTAVILRPISETSSRALSPHTPDVSTANGTKRTVRTRTVSCMLQHIGYVYLPPVNGTYTVRHKKHTKIVFVITSTILDRF